MLFDFARPEEKTLADTLLTLASLSRFMIADVTRPMSVGHELQLPIPTLAIPSVPIRQRGEATHSMFQDQ